MLQIRNNTDMYVHICLTTNQQVGIILFILHFRSMSKKVFKQTILKIPIKNKIVNKFLLFFSLITFKISPIGLTLGGESSK